MPNGVNSYVLIVLLNLSTPSVLMSCISRSLTLKHLKTGMIFKIVLKAIYICKTVEPRKGQDKIC